MHYSLTRTINGIEAYCLIDDSQSDDEGDQLAAPADAKSWMIGWYDAAQGHVLGYLEESLTLPEAINDALTRDTFTDLANGIGL